MEYTRPRLARAVGMAIRFLTESGVTLLPVDPVKLALDMGWKVRTYTEAGEKYPVRATPAEIGDMYGSGDAISFMNRRGTPVILYNDRISSQARISWSVAHEAGHILLSHFRDFDMRGMNDAQLKALDGEADAFAANLLAPACIVDALKKPLRPEQRKIFGLSERGWEVRLTMLARDRRYIPVESAAALRERLREFMYDRVCTQCGFRYRGGRCPECGSSKARWPGGEAVEAENRRMRMRRQLRAAGTVRRVAAALENPMLDDRLWGGESRGAYDGRRS